MVPFCSPLVSPLLESAQFSGELYSFYGVQVGTCMECEVTSVTNIGRQPDRARRGTKLRIKESILY